MFNVHFPPLSFHKIHHQIKWFIDYHKVLMGAIKKWWNILSGSNQQIKTIYSTILTKKTKIVGNGRQRSNPASSFSLTLLRHIWLVHQPTKKEETRRWKKDILTYYMWFHNGKWILYLGPCGFFSFLFLLLCSVKIMWAIYLHWDSIK